MGIPAAEKRVELKSLTWRAGTGKSKARNSTLPRSGLRFHRVEILLRRYPLPEHLL